MNKTYLGTLNILVSEREVNARTVNDIITKNGHLVRARLGMHLSHRCVKNCTGLITLIIEGTKDELERFAKSFKSHKFAAAKLCLISEVK